MERVQRAKEKFRQVKAESSRRLNVVYKKIGKKWVLKARPYYELLRQSHKVSCLFTVSPDHG